MRTFQCIWCALSTKLRETTTILYIVFCSDSPLSVLEIVPSVDPFWRYTVSNRKQKFDCQRAKEKWNERRRVEGVDVHVYVPNDDSSLHRIEITEKVFHPNVQQWDTHIHLEHNIIYQPTHTISDWLSVKRIFHRFYRRNKKWNDTFYIVKSSITNGKMQ